MIKRVGQTIERRIKIDVGDIAVPLVRQRSSNVGRDIHRTCVGLVGHIFTRKVAKRLVVPVKDDVAPVIKLFQTVGHEDAPEVVEARHSETSQEERKAHASTHPRKWLQQLPQWDGERRNTLLADLDSLVAPNVIEFRSQIALRQMVRDHQIDPDVARAERRRDWPLRIDADILRADIRFGTRTRQEVAAEFCRRGMPVNTAVRLLAKGRVPV